MSIIFAPIFIVAPEAETEALVDLKYVARVTGYAASTIRRGKAGTKVLRPVSRHPLRYVKAEVDRFATLKREKEERERSSNLSLVRRRPRKERAA